ncbi:MAG TPA: hypothetical protein VHE37_13875, partial [Nevskiaceae bacterium]|nr:hypothetical protein [Nevskiaceae bacterium]
HEPAAAIDQAYGAALQRAPADAYLWFDRAQVLAAQGRYGQQLETAAARAEALAPASPALRLAMARMGALHWFRSPAELQQLWLRSMRYELRHNQRQFLRSLIHDGEQYWFCASAALELPLDWWCAKVWDYEEAAHISAGAP